VWPYVGETMTLVKMPRELPMEIHLCVDEYTLAEMELTGYNLNRAGYYVEISQGSSHVWLSAWLEMID